MAEEYIEREDAINAALEQLPVCFEMDADVQMKGITCCGDCVYYSMKKHKCTRGYNEEGKATDHFYKDCPLPDVRLVVRGRWLTQEYMYGDKSVGIDDAWIERVAEKGECAYCSNCKEYAKLDGNEESALTPYCPNCGAKMDGGQDDA